MRPIKFRFFSNFDKKMYNNLTLIGLNTTCSQFDDPPVYNPPAVFRKDGSNTVQYYSDGHLMQFTGIHDKNGTEIYEHDLFISSTKLYIVVWLDFHAGFVLVEYRDWVKYETEDIRPLVYKDIASFQFVREVIGNIYENPSLLEVQP